VAWDTNVSTMRHHIIPITSGRTIRPPVLPNNTFILFSLFVS